jgi:hypothetical protein
MVYLREGLELLRKDEERLRYLLLHGDIQEAQRAQSGLARLKVRIDAALLEIKDLEAQQGTW